MTALCLILATVMPATGPAQSTPVPVPKRAEAQSQDKKGADAAAPAVDESKPAGRAELEKTFREMMTNAVLSGTWQMTRGEGLEGKAPLGKPRPEKYTVDSVKKILGDRWVVTARIQYADKDVKIPIPIRVVWAEDTPIITLDEIKIPLIGAYSARVMIYRNFYAGTWFGSNYGGVLSGQIVRETKAESDSKPAADESKKPADSKPAVKPGGGDDPVTPTSS